MGSTVHLCVKWRRQDKGVGGDFPTWPYVEKNDFPYSEWLWWALNLMKQLSVGIVLVIWMLSTVSLVPKSHPQGGKRIWWTWAESLGMQWGISTHQSDLSSGTVTWLAHRRNATSLQLCSCADQSYPSFAWLVGTHHSAWTAWGFSPSSPDPSPFSRVESGDRTIVP